MVLRWLSPYQNLFLSFYNKEEWVGNSCIGRDHISQPPIAFCWAMWLVLIVTVWTEVICTTSGPRRLIDEYTFSFSSSSLLPSLPTCSCWVQGPPRTHKIERVQAPEPRPYGRLPTDQKHMHWTLMQVRKELMLNHWKLEVGLLQSCYSKTG